MMCSASYRWYQHDWSGLIYVITGGFTMGSEHLSRMVLEKCAQYGNRDALASKVNGKWEKLSWGEIADQITAAAAGLLECGVAVDEKVAIFSQNRPEWAIADYAIMCLRGISVPIYATNSAEQAEYIVNDAGTRIVFVGGQPQYDAVMRFFGSNKILMKVIVFDNSVKIEKNENILYFSDLLETGKASGKKDEVQHRLAAADSDDVCTLIYTSGTTGDPKGAILTHGNFFSEFHCLDEGFPMDENNIALCFLPLSHAYEKCSDYWVQYHGATIYYCENPALILDYFKEVRPTYMVGVPRLYEKMYAAIYEGVEKASGLKRKIFNFAVRNGKEYHFRRLEGKFRSPLLRIKYAIGYKLVLKKIRDVLGGRLNFFSAGGAPLSHDIEEFFLASGIFIGQGYGLTETSPCIAANNPGKFRFGSVGPLFSCNQVRIAEDGEILVRGTNVTKGYYNKPKQTAESFTEDGWFMTGDIGYIDDDGFLFITDRKKDIIVTAGGKNIAPQQVESMVGKDFYVEQIITIGDKRKFISALVVPSFDALEQYAKENGIHFTSHEDLIQKPEVIALYEQRIAANTGSLSHAEQIKKFRLLAKPFSQESGEITPTMKIKRKVVEHNYKDIIDSMYQ